MNNPTETLPEWFKGTAEGEKIVRQAREKREAERKAAAEAITALRAKLEKELPPLQAKVETGKAKVDQARKRLREAERVLTGAHMDALRVSSAAQREIARHELFLRESADPAIDEFIAEMRVLHDRDRHHSIATREEPGKENLITGVREPIIYTNLESVNRRLEAIRAAINEAEALKLEAGVDVPARLAELRAGLPDAEHMERVK